MASEDELNRTISCLQHAVADVQGTIRAYDMKANILGVILTVALGYTNFTLIQKSFPYSQLLLSACWVSGLFALAATGAVLYPMRRPIANISCGAFSSSETYFISSSSLHQSTVTEMAAKALQANWIEELTFENMKLSLIRDYKHRWFVNSLKLVFLSLVLVGVTAIAALWS